MTGVQYGLVDFRARREALGLDREQLARLAGVKLRAIEYAEAGVFGGPSPSLDKLIRFFDDREAAR